MYHYFLVFEQQKNVDTSLSLFLLLIAVTFVRSVWQGQSNILLIACVLLGVVALSRGKDWQASFFLVAAAFIKVWPIALIMLLCCYRLRLIPKCVALILVFAFLPFLCAPVDTVTSQYQAWFSSLFEFHYRFASYRDFWTIWELIPFSDPDVRIYEALQLLTAFGIFVLTLWVLRQSRSDREKLFLILSLWVCWQLQIGPGTERMTYSIFAPVIAYAMVVYRNEGDHWYLLLTSFVLLAVFTHGSLERLFEPWLPFSDAMIVLSATAYFAWLLMHIASGRTAQPVRELAR